MKRSTVGIVLVFISGASLSFAADQANNDLFCAIREGGTSLACQWLRDRKAMTSDEIPAFVDLAATSTYIVVKSKKGLERTYLTDPNAPQFKHLLDLKKTGSMSDLSRAKSDLFLELEKRIIKVSDEQDRLSGVVEMFKYDPSIGTDKFRRENRPVLGELESFRKNKDKACTSTPAFEQLTRANAKLQGSLSSIITAFQTPGTCMSEFKIFKDRDGSVDLRQLDGVPTRYAESCKK